MQLVVAHYREDLSWLKNIPDGVEPIVYSKSEDPPANAISLPNIGREAHTYLTHIINHYDSFASPIPSRLRQGYAGQAGRGGEPLRPSATSPIPSGRGGYVVFCQGHPFDHCHDFHRRLSVLSGQLSVSSPETESQEPTAPVPHFAWLGFIIDTDDQRGRRLHVPWSKNTEGRELEMDRCHQKLFGQAGPEWYRFVVGGQFAVGAEQIISRPKSFYENALDLTLEYEDASYCLERMWDRIFGVDYVTDELLPASQMTRYLKPIKRLGNQERE